MIKQAVWQHLEMLQYSHLPLSCEGNEESLSRDWDTIQAVQPCQSDHIEYNPFVALKG